MSETVLSGTADRVCTVTLNRPDARNAMNSELQRALALALADAEADDGVDVVVLTGADPAFCAGLDLRELGSTGANLVGGRDDEHRSPFTVLWTMTKPVIGAINGAAVTGGFELALACDFLIASERATFGDTHARVGVTPGGGMSVFLRPRLEAQRWRRARARARALPQLQRRSVGDRTPPLGHRRARTRADQVVEEERHAHPTTIAVP
jgi:enoyl-CoA hydratase/carnithine racemase